MIQISLGSEFTDQKLNSREYVNFDSIVGVQIVTHVLSILSVFFVPFRFFTLCSHFKFFTAIANMLKIYFRMLFGLLTFFIIIMAIVLIWTFPIFMLLSPYCYEFRDYPTSIITVLMKDFWEENDYKFMVRESPYEFLFSIIVITVIG